MKNVINRAIVAKKNYSKYIWMFLMLLGISVSQQAWATVETFDLSDSGWNWPNSFSQQEVVYTNCKALTIYNVRLQSGGVIMQEGNKNCTNDALLGYILLPTFNGTVSTVTLTFLGGASTQELTLYAGSTSKGSKETTSIIEGTTVSWTNLNIASGTVIKIRNECGAKAQLKTITVEHNGTSNPCYYNIYYDNEGSGSVSGPGYAAAGETVNFTLSPASGWHNNGALVYDDTWLIMNEILDPGVASFTMPATDVNVYAYFASCTPSTVTLSGSPAGTVTNGTISASPSSACEGATVSLTPTPATGYKLSSWDVYKTGASATKVSVTNNAFSMPAYGVTVNATFAAKQSAITFDKNGGTGGDNGTTGTYGSAMTTVTAPTREGYDFGGYYDAETSNNGSGTKYYNNDGTSARTWDKNTEAASTLYANWTEKEYSVTLDNNSPTTAGSTSVTVTYNKSTHTAITNPSKDGKSFAGWWSGSGGTGSMVIASDGTLQANVEGYTGANGIWTRTATPTTLYAKWADTYSVAIASVDHVTIKMTSPSTVNEGSSGNVTPTTTVTLNYSNVEAANGYSWYGWNVYKTGDPSTTVSVNNSNQFTMPEYDVTVSAKLFGELVAWCEAQVIYKAVGEDDHIATIDGSGNVPAYSPQIGCDGKAFVGWASAEVTSLQQTSPTITTADGSLTGVDANTTLYAVYASRNGGKITGSETLSITETFENATPTKGTNQTVPTACASDVMAWEYCYGKVTTTTITNVGPNAGTTFADLMMYAANDANYANTSAYIRTTRMIDNLSKVSFYVKANGGTSNNSYSVEYSTDGSVWTAIKSGESFTTTYTEKEYEIPSSVPSAYIRIIASHNVNNTNYHLCIDDVKFYTKARAYYLTDYSTTCDKAVSATVTWNNDGGTLSDGYSEPTSPALGTWVMMPHLSKDNYRFDGWKATVEGDLKADVYAVDGLFLVNHNVTLTAQWSELFQVSNPATGVTSAKDQQVRSATFTMKVIGDRSITPVIDGLSDAIQFAVTVGTGTDSGTSDKTFAYTFTFTPSAYKNGQGVTDNATFRFKDEASGTVSSLVTIKGRALPEKFIIAAKKGGQWYALPANCSNSGTYAGVLVSVNNVNDPSSAVGADTLGWGLRSVDMTHRSEYDTHITLTERLTTATANDQKPLYNYSSKNLGLSAMWKNYWNAATPAGYEWIATSDNMKDYTITSNASTTVSLGTNGKFGTLSSSMEYDGKVRLLPITELTNIDMEVMEWGESSMALRINGTAPSAVDITLGNTTWENKSLTNINSGSTSDIYKVEGLTLTSNDCKVMRITDHSDETKGTILLKPILVHTTDALGSDYGDDLTDEVCATCDLIILPNGKLTADQAKTSHTSFANIYVYPGGALILDGYKESTSQKGSIGVKNKVYLRGGYSWLAPTTYALPEIYLNGTSDAKITFTGSANITYDYYIQNYKYYQFCLPYTVALADVTDEAKVSNFPVWVKHYNGALRAANGGATSWEWYGDDNTTELDDYFYAGIGYIIAARPRQVAKVQNRPLSIIRFPLGNSAFSDCTGETEKSVNTIAHGIDGYNAGTVSANNVGWNFVGNPYMSAWQGNIGQSQLEKDMSSGTWNGKYVWTDSDAKYITVMSPEDGTDYDQYLASGKKLNPFFPFYMQETASGGTGTLTFALSSRVKRLLLASQTSSEREAFVQIDLTDGNDEDRTGFYIGNKYSDALDFDDLEKMFGSSTNRPKAWLMHDATRMAFEAMTENRAAGSVALGYRSPKDGTYTFVLDENSKLEEVEAVLLSDYEAGVYDFDLMKDAYTFHSTKVLHNDERFSIRIVLKDETANTTTSQENAEGLDISIASTKDGIVLQGLPSDAKVWVYDMTGKMLMSGDNAATGTSTMMLQLPTGVYNVRVVSATDACTIKAIVK